MTTSLKNTQTEVIVGSASEWRTMDDGEGHGSAIGNGHEAGPQVGSQNAASSPDRPLVFARKAREQSNKSLVRCEERFPSTGVHSVLYIVVERDAPQWRDRLNALHYEVFDPDDSDPLAPVRLEVVDRATHEALERLANEGLLKFTARGWRQLFPEPDEACCQPLSASERARAQGHRTQAARKLKMARLLGEGGLEDEARGPLLDAALSLGRALAVENRLPDPGTLAEALLPPLSHCWASVLSLLRQYASDSTQPWKIASDALYEQLSL